MKETKAVALSDEDLREIEKTVEEGKEAAAEVVGEKLGRIRGVVGDPGEVVREIEEGLEAMVGEAEAEEITWVEWRKACESGGGGPYVVVAMASVPNRCRGDIAIRNENVREGVELCGNCDGTGNELWAMYRECEECEGTGKAGFGKGGVL